MNTPKLDAILRSILDLPDGAIGDDLSPDSAELWDSESHVHLVLALEDEFGVAIPPEDGAELLTVGAIRAYLKQRGAGLA